MPVSTKPSGKDSSGHKGLQSAIRRTPSATWVTLDLFHMSVAMLSVVLAYPIVTHQMEISQILKMRISLLNALVAVLCIGSWRLCMMISAPALNFSRISLPSLLRYLALCVTLCTGVASAILWLRHPYLATFWSVIAYWLISFALLSGSRIAYLLFDLHLHPIFNHKPRILIVGSGRRAQNLAHQLESRPQGNCLLLGFVDSEPQGGVGEVLGGLDQLESILMRHVVDEVIIALPVKSKYDDIQKAIAICERTGVQSEYSTDLFVTEVTKRRSVNEHSPSSIVLHMVHNDRRRLFKRVVDVAGAAFGLIFFLPLFAVVALAIVVSDPGPIIFRQERYGLNKRLFTMYKFRSMVINAEAQQAKIEHLNESTGPVFKIRQDPRVTPIGRFIRKTSIDELPQLLNVLKGDMSLVGPRPLPMRDVNQFSEPWLMRRFSVKPGLTGLWQVSGRSNTAFSNWIRQDLEYIDQWNLFLDLKIIARTFPAVLKKDGAV